MRYAGKMAARLLEYIEPFVKPNVSTLELNNICNDWINSRGFKSATLNYKGFPKSICTSINDVVCHGIPKKEDILKIGDIINIDITLIVDNYHGDTSKTFTVGEVDFNTKKLVNRTRDALYIGIDAVAYNHRINLIGKAIEEFIQPFGYSVVTALGGHGIGKYFHEEPFVAHYKQRSKGIKLKDGMTFTIEPMINLGGRDVFTDPIDNWTIYTEDGSLSAQFEHTILVTKSSVEILTLSD